jgi:integrase
MGAPELVAFLSWLAVDKQVSASTQNQALSAVVFLYKQVLGLDLGPIEHVPRARMPDKLPVVLSREELALLLKQLDGTMWLIVAMLYGTGVRLEECLELRIKDLDFERSQVTVRRGKGQKDRVTMLPASVRQRLAAHLVTVKDQHERDLARGEGRVALPFALERKYPAASKEWGWQFVFPATRICRDPRWGSPPRFHLHESVVQKAVTYTTNHSFRARSPGHCGNIICPHRLGLAFSVVGRNCGSQFLGRGQPPRPSQSAPC